MSKKSKLDVPEKEQAIVENVEEQELEVTTQELDRAAALYAEKTGGDDFPRGPQFPHAGNIAKKLRDHRGKETTLASTIEDILLRYRDWRKATLAASGDKTGVISKKVKAFDAYSAFLDTEPVDEFDSRGALVSSALEEFCYYLLKPLLDDHPDALLGKQNTYQGLYFTAGSFKELLSLPTAHTPENTLDFIIGVQVQGIVKGKKGDKLFDIRLPAVAVECKGYLDRPRFIESQSMARAIKSAFPQCLYILVSQSLKLDLKKIGIASDIDGIYVWRRMQNIDRKIRRKGNVALNPHHVSAVEHFYDRVALHLKGDWQMADPFGSGILK